MENSSLKAERLNSLAELPLTRVGTNTSFIKGAGQSYKDIWDHRQLLWLLVKREVRAKYKGSSLGILWSFARPLVQLMIYYFVIGQVLGVARSIPDFAIYVFVGLTVWGLFAEIINSAPNSILSNSGIIKKVYLPREIFPLSSIASSFFTFFTQFIILVLALAVFNVPPHWSSIPVAILGLLVLLVFASSLAILISAVNVYVRDVQHFTEVIVGLLFWATPIVYSFAFVKTQLATWAANLYLANPVTLSVIAFQEAFWSAGSSNADAWPSNLELRLLVALFVSLILLLISQRIFARLQVSFAQEL